MARLLTALVLAVVLVAGTSPAAPVAPQPRKVVVYFPTAVGATRTLRGGHGGLSTETVTEVADLGRAKRVLVERSHIGGGEGGIRAAGRQQYELLVSAEGVATAPAYTRLRPNTRFVRTSSWLFQPPPARWQNIAATPWDQATITVTSFPPERVTVPAGTFDAVRVHSVWAYGDGGLGPQENMEWRAPGVGVVKMLYQDRNGTESFVLQSFTPGKD